MTKNYIQLPEGSHIGWIGPSRVGQVALEDIYDQTLETINEIGAVSELPYLDEAVRLAQGPEDDITVKAVKILLSKLDHLSDHEKNSILKYRDIFMPDRPGEKFTFLKTPPVRVPCHPLMPAEIKPPYKRHLSPEKQKALTQFIAEGLNSGLVLPEKYSTVASPAMVLEKSDGSHRILCDPRAVNKWLLNVQINQPDVSNSIRNLGNCSLFSKIDFKSAFIRQIVEEADQYLSTIVNPGGELAGCYKLAGLGIGLMNSPGLFNSSMNEILCPLSRPVWDPETETEIPLVLWQCFIDDLICGHRGDRENCMRELLILLDRLHQYNVRIDPRKIDILTDEIEWCGNILKDGKIYPDLSRFSKLGDLKPPASLDPNATCWKKAFGLFSYFRRFIRNYAKLEQQIKDALEDCREKRITTDEKNEIVTGKFKEIAAAINGAELHRFDENEEIFLEVDASGIACGFVAYRKDELGHKLPCWFGSQSFSATQRKYKTHEKELLGCISALDKIKHLVSRARKVHVFTDNLTNLLQLSNTGKIHELSGRAIRLLLQLQSRLYSDKISYTHIGTLTNWVADHASRLDFGNEEHKVRSLAENGDQVVDCEDLDGSGSLSCDVITRARAALRKKEGDFGSVYLQLKSLHSATHSGPEKLAKTARHYNLGNDLTPKDLMKMCKEICSNCDNCFSTVKIMANNVLGQIPLPPREMHTLVIDHVHLPVVCLGTKNRYLLTALCAFSRFLFAVPVPDKNMTRVASLIYVILQLFPQIRKIRGDNAFDCLSLKTLPVEIEIGAVHNSRSNLVEISHKSLWQKIRAFQAESGAGDEKIDVLTSKATAAYNRLDHGVTGVPPFELINASKTFNPADPIDIYSPSKKLAKLRKKVKSRHDPNQTLDLPIIKSGTEILVRYSPKQRKDIRAKVVCDSGLTVLAEKEDHSGRYRRTRVPKRYIYVKKAGFDDVYEKSE